MRFIFPCADPFFSRGFRGSAHPQAQVDKFQVWVSGWTLKKCGNGKSFNSQLKKKSFFGRRISFNPQFFPFPSHSTPAEIPKGASPIPAHPRAAPGWGGKKREYWEFEDQRGSKHDFFGGEGINFGSIPCFRFGWKSPILLLGWRL